jgi:hypothetical protein
MINSMWLRRQNARFCGFGTAFILRNADFGFTQIHPGVGWNIGIEFDTSLVHVLTKPETASV